MRASILFSSPGVLRTTIFPVSRKQTAEAPSTATFTPIFFRMSSPRVLGSFEADGKLAIRLGGRL